MTLRTPPPAGPPAATLPVRASARSNQLFAGERRPEEAPLPRAVENQSVTSPTLLLFVVLAMLGVIAYTIFLFDPSNRGDWLPYSLVIIAEVVLVSQAMLSMWTILSGSKDPRDFLFHHAQERLFDSTMIRQQSLQGKPTQWPMLIDEKPIEVDVFITVYGEPLETIERTVRAALGMRGQHLTWVLDDGRSDAVRELCSQLGARYVRRLSSNGAKAGNVNHALSITRGDYFVILDADFVAQPDFLYETVPFFVDSTIAFVQTPQAYGNLHTLISRGAAYMQQIFYRFVQPGRNSFNAAFSVGTNVIYRRAAITDIGGMHTDSKSEDVWTSYELHQAGWKSVYIPVTLAIGDAPETIEDYSKQQLRWATGGFEILLRANPLSPKRRLTVDQRVQYLVTATHYLVGIVPLLLLMVPPMEVYFDLRPVNLTVTWVTWLLFYLGFYGLQIMLAFTTMGSFRWETLMLASVSFPIYVRAFINVLVGREQAWHVTGGARDRSSPFNVMVFQTLFFWFLFLTSIVAIYKDVGNGALTLATAWNVTNTIIIGAFILTAASESRQIARQRRRRRAAERAERRAARQRARASRTRRGRRTLDPPTPSDTGSPSDGGVAPSPVSSPDRKAVTS
jgi:cellulose synthase (UDP-forming)